MKQINWTSVEVDGVDGRDYPDFCDAYFSYAEYQDGTVLTDDELEALTESQADRLNEMAMGCLMDGAEDFGQDR
jgi:hypothetical protein